MTTPYQQKRIDGYLAKLSRITRIKRAIYFDTETHIIYNDDGSIDFPLRLGYALYVEYDTSGNEKKREDIQFYTSEGFIDFLIDHTSTRSRLYVFAHNIGFDLRVIGLRDILSSMVGQSEPPIINQRVFIFDWHTENGLITFLDTANYGVTSVKSLGKDLGFNKLEVDFDTVSDSELMVYCQRDVEILALFMQTFQSFLISNDLGPTKHTLASQALATFKYRFMHNPPFIHTNEKALELEKDGYKGGRTECFHIGALPDGIYYYLDVNSIYPYAMSMSTLPVRFVGYSENVPLPYLKPRLANNYVIADVLVKTDSNDYPYTEHGKLLFPTGVFRTVLHSPELELAVQRNEIIHVYRCAVYKQAKVFDSYVDFFYQLKKQHTTQHNQSFRMIDKLFLNSLYGKFGQDKVIRQKIAITAKNAIFRVPCINLDTQERSTEIGWLGQIIRETRGGETPHTSKALAGSVTSHARRLMLDYLYIAGKENCYYMDTDSLIVNQSGYDRLLPYLNDLTLGYFKLEKQDTQVTIFGPKDYQFGDIVHHKGVPSNAIVNKQGKWEYVQFEGLTTFLNDGAKNKMRGKIVTKDRKMPYTKGIVNPNTGKVTPISLPR